MKRFLTLAMIVMILVLACAQAFALPVAYVVNACTAGALQNAWYTSNTYARTSTNCRPPLTGWSANGTTTGHALQIEGTLAAPTYTDITALTSSGVAYWFARASAYYGQWDFKVPAGKSGYYKVYTAWGDGGSWLPTQEPCVFTLTNAAADQVTSLTETSALANAWQALSGADTVQLNEGVTYHVRGDFAAVASPDTTKRIYWGSTAWVYQSSNTPASLTATPAGDGSAVNLSWTAPTPAPASYTVECSTDAMATWTVVQAGVTATTFADTTAPCDTTLYYRVKAVDGAGIVSGPSSPSLPVVKCVTAPAGKATCISPAIDADGVHAVATTLQWAAGTAAVKHDVYFGTANPPTAKVSTAQTGLTWTTGALLPNTDYYWRIDEYNGKNVITTGDVWHFKTGVSLTIIPIRAANRGSIESFWSPDMTDAAPRAWNTTTWHKADDVIILSAPAATGYTWVGFSDNADGSSPYPGTAELWQIAFSMPSTPTNKTLYCVYQGDRFTLSVDTPGNGTVSASRLTYPSNPGDYEAGDVAQIVATPAAGYQFAGWETSNTGTFNNPYAATAQYTMAAENTVIHGYFAKCAANLSASVTRCIAAGDANGTSWDDWWTTQCNIGAYSTSPTATPALWARDLVKFEDWAGFNSVPNASLQVGLGKLTGVHQAASNYSGSTTLNVSAYPILSAWSSAGDATGAWWKWSARPTTGDVLWTTAGGDMDTANQLGTAQAFVGNPAADTAKTYVLKSGVDYRTLLANGVEFVGDKEGDITYRKGFAKTSALAFFYNPPSNFIKSWAYLGFFAQGVDADHQLRMDTDELGGTVNGISVADGCPIGTTSPYPVSTLAPSTGKTYNGKSWAVGTSATDSVDFVTAGAGFYGVAHPDGVTYAAVYVKNTGANVWPCYLAMGSDDFSGVWTNGTYRGVKAVAEGVILDKTLIGPFTLTGGNAWTRIVVKIENGASAHGLAARLCNADRTAVSGLTFATTDSTAPSAPAITTNAAVVNAPTFTFSGVTDSETAGEGVSGVRGFKVYWGTDPAGVPSTVQTTWTYAPGTITAGTYYLRVSSFDYALNESAVTTKQYIYSAGTPVAKINDLFPLADGDYKLTGKTVTGVVGGAFWIEESNRTAAIKCIGTGVTVGQKYDVIGHLQTLNGERVLNTAVASNGAAGDTINPLIMVSKSAGGQATTTAPSVVGGVGVYNIGMLVKIAGAVTDSGSGYFVVSDGNWTTFKVLTSVSKTGNVAITGFVGTDADGTLTLTPRSNADIQ